jgi:hypothetical protein
MNLSASRDRRFPPGSGGCFSQASIQTRPQKLAEERMGGGWLRFEFRMALHGDEPRMVSQFDDFD